MLEIVDMVQDSPCAFDHVTLLSHDSTTAGLAVQGFGRTNGTPLN